MLHHGRWFAGLLLLLASCGVPAEEQESDFRAKTSQFFARLNADAEARRLETREQYRQADEKPELLQPTGAVVSLYSFRPEGILLDVICPLPACGSRQVVEYVGRDVYCARCGGMESPSTPEDQWQKLVTAKRSLEELKKLEKEGSFSVLSMFELQAPSEEGAPLRATVRYVRRTFGYDPRGSVRISKKALEGKSIVPEAIPGYVDASTSGFHRPADAFVGTGSFEYSGGAITLLALSSGEGADGEVSATEVGGFSFEGVRGFREEPLGSWTASRSVRQN